MDSPTFKTLMAPMIAKAHEVLKTTREAGKPEAGVVALIVVARIIERDMFEMCEVPPPEAYLQRLEELTRLEIERIFTREWVRQ